MPVNGSRQILFTLIIKTANIVRRSAPYEMAQIR